VDEAFHLTFVIGIQRKKRLLPANVGIRLFSMFSQLRFGTAAAVIGFLFVSTLSVAADALCYSADTRRPAKLVPSWRLL
jgi:hypothetical protein